MAQLGPEWQVITMTQDASLYEALQENGFQCRARDGVWYSTDPTGAQSFINGFDASAYAATKDAEAQTENRATVVVETDSKKSPIGTRDRALIGTLNKRINWLTNRVIELQEDLQAIKGSSGPANAIRDAIRPGYSATATRPRPDAIQAFKDDVNAGEGDPV